MMSWHRIGAKPLSEPKMSQFIDTYTRHWTSMIKILKPRDAYISHLNWIAISPDNGLSSISHRAITWGKADLLMIRPPRTYFNDTWIERTKFLFKNMHLKMSSAKSLIFCSVLKVLIKCIKHDQERKLFRVVGVEGVGFLFFITTTS